MSVAIEELLLLREPTTRRRDTQKQRVYDVERATLWGNGRSFETLDDVQRYVDELTLSRRFVERFGYREIECVRGIAKTSARGYRRSPTRGLITLPTWAWNEPVILHEIAHTLAPADCVHGGEFVGILKLLVKLQMPDFVKAYGDELFERNVDVTPPPAADVARVKSAAAKRRALVEQNRKTRQRERESRRRVAAALRAEKQAPPTRGEIDAAVNVIRRAAKSGVWGPNGSTMRTRALTAARQLEASTR